jgi:hypothetical protein
MLTVFCIKSADERLLLFFLNSLVLDFYSSRVLEFDSSGILGKEDFWDFLYFCLRLTLLHGPPLRFHRLGGCWDRMQDCCDFGIDSQTL